MRHQFIINFRYDDVKYLILIVCINFVIPVFSQENNPLDNEQQASLNNGIASDSTVKRNNGLLTVFEGKPGTALWRGLIIPSGGQIYNRQWWKVPLALGAEGAAIYWLAYTYDRFSAWDQEYINVAINGDPPSTTLNNEQLILKKRNYWRTQRELGWVIWGVTHIFIAFEAYIDRHLIDFDISDDLTFIPEMTVLGPVTSLSYSIPLNTKRIQKVNNKLMLIP